ncbi:MAG: hypothetical protein NWR09_02575 [Pseudomonadales bacterium]|nr:hypothetical protein [Pseudomonadales bacterium]
MLVSALFTAAFTATLALALVLVLAVVCAAATGFAAVFEADSGATFGAAFGVAFEVAVEVTLAAADPLPEAFTVFFFATGFLTAAVFVTAAAGDFALLAALAEGAFVVGVSATEAFAVLLAWGFPSVFLADVLAVGLFLVLAAIVQSSMLCRGKPKQNRARTLPEAGCFAK